MQHALNGPNQETGRMIVKSDCYKKLYRALSNIKTTVV